MGLNAAVATEPPAGSFPVKTYDASVLDKDAMMWCATQDDKGVLYFGGDKLFVNDGERWRSYKMGDTYAVRSLEFGPDGRLWAAGTNELGWFERTPTDAWQYHSLRSKLPAALKELGDVWNVYPTPQGAIFVSDRQVLTWNGSRFTWQQYDPVRRLISTRDQGEVYISNRATGLLKIGPEAPKLIISPDALGPYGVFWMGDNNGRILYITSGGAGYLVEGKLRFQDDSLSAFLQKNVLTAVRRLPDGSFALSTLRGGIALVRPDLKLKQILTTQNGLPTNEVYGLFVARGGALWAMANTQIFRVNPLAGVTLFNEANGLPAAGAMRLDTTQDSIVVLTREGAMQLRTSPEANSTFVPLGKINGFSRDIKSSPEGLLISSNYGVYTVDQTSVRQLYHTPLDVYKVLPTKTPGIYNAAVDRKIVQFSTNGAPPRDLTLELPDTAENFLQDDSGRLWISTGSKGLLVAQLSDHGPAPAEPASVHYGFPAAGGRTLVARFAHTLVGIGPDRAWWLNPQTDRFEPVHHFPQGTATAVSNADAQGRVWVTLEPEQAGMPARIGQVVRTPTGVEWQPRSIEDLARAGNPRALRVQSTSEGDVLWVAGSSALLRVDQPAQMPAIPPPAPLLHAIVRDQTDGVDRPVSAKLPYTTRRLRLEFSSTAYDRRDSLRYQTMLDGVDSGWSAPSNVAEQDLTNLREGVYDFKVRMISDTGLASEPAVLHFSIAAPWWRTPYAYGGYAVSLILLLSGLYGLRLRTVRRRAELLEDTVRHRTAELEKANAAKTEFVASMSHEIRNPMNGIIGSATALADTDLNEEQRELVANLRNCSTFLASLVEDVLDFSSIEAGVFNVQQQPCNPAEILEAVANMLSAPAAVAGAHFDIEVDPALPARFSGDPARIQQIVVNYATNALKFSGGGRVRLSAYTDNNCVAFAVTDDGPGISTEDQAVLFTRFSRLKTARNAGIPGAGLGLAVCRAVAEHMRGTVGVASAPGRGATFFLRVPLVAAREAAPAAHPVPPSMVGARALIVEDLDYNARALGAMLRKLGFTVDLARNGEEALRQLANHAYHSVFLDYDLPDMSGPDVVRRLRAREKGRAHTLVIATTAYSTMEDRDACLAAGMDKFLSKPITPGKLHAALADLPGTPLPAPSLDLPAAPGAEVNLRILAYLAGDDAGALQREIGRYLDSLSAIHQEVTGALSIRSRHALGKAAHHMLSHARMIEAAGLTAAAEKLEDAADFADDEELERLEAQMAAAVAALRKTLARHHSPSVPA